MTRWGKAAGCAAILLFQSCVPGEIATITSPTLLVAWRAAGAVHQQQFASEGEIACIPVPVGTEFKTLGYEAFPRWTSIPLNPDSVLVLNVSAACYVESLSQEDILVDGYVFEANAHPRWVRPIGEGQWQIHLERTAQKIATSSDRRRIVSDARSLMQSMDIFCTTCDPTRSPDPFTRIIRKDVSEEGLPPEFFERWGDSSAGVCRRSRPIPIPGFIEQAGLEERHLSTCTRLRREDPLDPDIWPSDQRCDALAPRLSTLAPNASSTTDDRIWRRSEFADPLPIDGCSVVLDEAIASFRRGSAAGDLRLYRSVSSTFTLYAGEGVGILQLYERGPVDLRRARLELAP